MPEPQVHEQLNRALYFLSQGVPEQARRLLSELAERIPNNPDVHFVLGITHSTCGDKSSAVAAYECALTLRPDFVDAQVNRAADLCALGNNEMAIAGLEAALRWQPQNHMVWLNLGNCRKFQGGYKEALAAYDKALMFAPTYSEAWCNRGEVLSILGRHNEALESLSFSVKANPTNFNAYYNLGLTLVELKRYEDGIAAYLKSLEICPDSPSVHNNLGIAYAKLAQYENAIESFRATLILDQDFPDAWMNLGNAFQSARQYINSIEAYRNALQQSRVRSFDIMAALLHVQMKICYWDDYADLQNALTKAISEGGRLTSPFGLLGLPFTERQLQLVSEGYARSNFGFECTSERENVNHDSSGRLKIAYLSADFYNHATAYLMAELFELHDRSRFEVIGLCYARSPNDRMRSRLAKGFDQFIDASEMPDTQVASLLAGLGVDIAIDLKGHTQDSRLGIFKDHPAPIQIHYLGYPGTLGTNFIDYLVADSVLVPDTSRCFYDEKLIYLPDSYQVNDRLRKIPNKIGTRVDHGLPEKGLVFCCFNNNWKITPDVFAVWMEILGEIEGSVLWLYQDNEWASENLFKEAKKNGISPDRLVFARKIPLDDHLNRLCHADLFLDTWYYNAHTTASDALWAGVPLVTKLGDTYAARVAASLLMAIGIPEMVTNSAKTYKELVLDLASNPCKLALIREKIIRNRPSMALFDTPKFTKNLESAYEAIWDRYQAGLAPDHIFV